MLSNFFVILVLATGVSVLFTDNATAAISHSDSTPTKVMANKDAKAIVTDYINTIGGADAIKKINSTSATGTLSVQGMSLDVKQARLAPNKTLQTIIMNGNTVGKTVFNGEKGYQEQMGNRVDMTDEDIADMKMQTSVIPQTDYLSNPNYKLSTQDIEKVNDADAYKVLVVMPSGKTDTEYYDVASKLLVKQIVTRSVNGQSVLATYGFSDYRKTGDVLLPYKLDISIASGAMTQSIDISLNEVKINEGVTDADFN